MTDLLKHITAHIEISPGAAEERVDLAAIDEIVVHLGPRPDAAIPILQAIQAKWRYLPEWALRRVADITQITPAQIAGVSSFYGQFRHKPMGRHVLRVCVGTACHVKNASLVYDALARGLGIGEHEDTDSAGLFTIEKVACLGCCTLAPVVQIDHTTYGHLTPGAVPRMLQDFMEQERRRRATKPREHAPTPAGVTEIRLGLGSCCVSRGSAKVWDALAQAIDDLGAEAHLKRVGCVGMCHQTPLLEIVPPDGPSSLYARVRPEDARALLMRHFRPKGLGGRLSASVSSLVETVFDDRSARPLERYRITPRDPEVRAFLDKQRHLSTEYYGAIDPTDLDEYLAHRGFEPLKLCLTQRAPDEIIEEISKSGLRGRGGAGYPTGVKWSHVHRAHGARKFLVVNGDEGDPGAFMDRMLLESYPYRVIEGAMIGAFAVGAHEGIFYIRAEYPLAVERTREALRKCEERGILGDNIFGSGFSLRLRVMEGAGAFVCGEETALLASLEGRRGMPRIRPPYPAHHGLWGSPTLVNNVETFSLVPWIVREGAAAFASLGADRSHGTKVFALAGKIARGGLIEVPTGITIREIVNDIGGGIAEGRAFKAVQVGGPSGGCIPAALADTKVDYESLSAVGAMMGSGGFVVLDDRDCMVEIARYFLSFTQDQSCGKCTFCRVGTRRMLDILESLCAGTGRAADIKELERLARSIRRSSLCGLGRTAPNPILTTLQYFRDEYDAHVAGKCPAGKCRALIHYVISDKCIGCTLCSQHCPVDAIPFDPYRKHRVLDDRCIRCGTCKSVCPADAVEVT